MDRDRRDLSGCARYIKGIPMRYLARVALLLSLCLISGCASASKSQQRGLEANEPDLSPQSNSVELGNPAPTVISPDSQSIVPLDAVCFNQQCPKSSFNYLIVTRPAFLGSLNNFVTWKTSNGFRVGIVTVEWLNTTFIGRHMAERMKTGM